MAAKHSTGWTLTRTSPDDTEGDEVETPIWVVYTWSPGCPARLHLANGDPGWPAEDPEVEIVSATVDILNGDPVELSEPEVESIRGWIIENHQRECARWDD